MKRLLISWAHKALMGLVIAAAAIVPIRIASRATQPDQALDPAEAPGGGIVVRCEVLHLWLPAELADLASQQARAPVVRDHGELRRLFRHRDQQDLWYALTARCHQANGLFVDITIIRRPCHDPQHFSEFLAVLGIAGGDPSRDPDSAFSTASIRIIPADLARREPRGAIGEILQDPPAPLRPTRAGPGRRQGGAGYGEKRD